MIKNNFYNKDLIKRKKCLYCGSSKLYLAYEDLQDITFYNISGYWHYFKCKNCSSLFLNPFLKKNRIHLAYDSYYTHNINYLSNLFSYLKKRYLYFKYSNSIFYLYFLQFFSRFIEIFIHIKFEYFYLRNIKNKNLLDYGCGSGEFVKFGKFFGCNALGFDFDKKTTDTNTNIIYGSENDLLKLDKKFDIIICSHVIEHVYNPKKLIDIFYNKLNKNGYLLISCPNANSHVLKKYNKFWRGFEAPRHISVPSFNGISVILNKSKFKIIKSFSEFYLTSNESLFLLSRSKFLFILGFFYYRIKKLFFSSYLKENDSDFIQLVCKK